MKIGLVLSKTPQYSETFFISKIKGLQNGGHEVVLFVQNKHPEFSLCEVVKAPKMNESNVFVKSFVILKVVFKLMLFPRRILKFIKLERLAKRSWSQLLKNVINKSHMLMADVDCLHFGFATMALQSEHVAKTIGAKMAISFRGFDIAIYPINHPGCYNLLWQHLDKVHTISNDLLELAYTLGLPKSVPVSKITPAIDVKMFSRKKPLNTELDLELNILTVARLHWKKGLIYTLEALYILKEKGYKFHYSIIGSGPQREELMFTIHQLSLENEVTLIGHKTPLEVKDFMDTSTYYLQYSISEGFCNAVLEAQAMGCLCVVSDAEGLVENVLHKKTGWVISGRNPELLAETLLNVIHLPEEEKQIIKTKARERVIDAFSIEKQRKDFLKFYETFTY